MPVNYKSALEQYNPYISQIPVDAYTKVGMYKQQLYDTGVQKIQDTVDKISGLDVANVGGRQYLQSRVNELTTKLNQYGYADLSSNDNI